MKSASKKNHFSLSKTIKNSKFDFVGNLKWFIIPPIIIAIIGVILFFTIGFNQGIDFTGGTIITVVTEGKYDVDKESEYGQAKKDIEDVLNSFELKGSIYQKVASDYGDAISVRYQDKSNISEEDMNALNEDVVEALFNKFGYDSEDLQEMNLISSGQRISATASSELLMNAFIAMIIAVVLILIYIMFRFEFTSAMAAIMALIHDIILTACFMLIFRVQINSSFVAALITILGYSINNTIIIFDRIRERSKEEKFAIAPNKVIANDSIKDTMSRSINTTVTTLLTIGMIAIMGVSSIREFAFPIIIGILCGFYSSIFIAPGLWSISHDPTKKRRKIKKEETEIEIIEA